MLACGDRVFSMTTNCNRLPVGAVNNLWVSGESTGVCLRWVEVGSCR